MRQRDRGETLKCWMRERVIQSSLKEKGMNDEKWNNKYKQEEK